ncbi:HugZ family pyridoxamine 5'-phosphate oxidase [Methylovirgula sp. 4M-Z18]|uniref:HugZ family pyridoxamine 5'-phosphate oxidase n=1 Tax=Methylovirgula sp. 4M-Z18 TaxID=2293567 RepID=UPI0013143067|nr:pyridoxamine 5'-phosphate oxidase family protein [Methylovirgula sp. 4M-Z18]
MTNPILPTDAAARDLALRLIREGVSASLATLDPSGHPFASLIAVAGDDDARIFSLMSALSAHTKHLAADPRCALLIAPGGKGDPLAHPRLSLKCQARWIARESDEGQRARERLLHGNPGAKIYIDFLDFRLVVFDIQAASLNAGFGKAYELSRNDLF